MRLEVRTHTRVITEREHHRLKILLSLNTCCCKTTSLGGGGEIILMVSNDKIKSH